MLSKLSKGNSRKLTSLDAPDFRWKQTVDGDGNASLTITAYVGTDKQVSVPAIIDDAEVTALNDNLFKDNITITRVSLPITLTSIGNYAFSGCTALQQVDLPDYLERIGNYAFQNCSKLDNVVLSEELTDLGAGAFYNCSRLSAVRVPGSVGVIVDRPNSSYGVFQGCKSLKALSLGEGLTSVGSYAFYGCNALEKVTLPESMQSVHTYAFYSSTAGALKQMLIPKTVTSIGNSIVNGKLTVYCYHDSTADTWAQNAGHTIVYLDGGMEDARSIALPEDFRLICGESRQILAELFPSFDDDVVVWESSDSKIARVSGGLITAVSQGEATITATIDGVSDELVVTCYVPIEDFALSQEETYVLRKQSLQLSTQDHMPQNADVSFVWSTSNTNYATVDQNGYVTTKKPGDVRIIATSDNGIVRECLLHICYPVTAIQFAEETMDKYIGDEFQMEAQVTASIQHFVNQLVKYSSSDESIATVTEDGLVNILWVGEVTITATAENGVSVDCVIKCHCVTHTPETDKAVAATCTNTGLTEGSHCSVCNEILVPQEIVPVISHTIAVDAAVEPTCTETGLTEGSHCSVCGTVLVEQTVIPANGHTVVDTVAVSPTCERVGYTAGKYCTACEMYLEGHEEIAAYGNHDWSTSYGEWFQDGDDWKITATRTCQRENCDSGENGAPATESETATASSAITTPATCVADGVRTWTATFVNEAFETKTRTDAIPTDTDAHDWNEATYNWSDDNSSVTATVTCKNNGEHKATETVNTTSNQTKAPTYFAKGETTYTATFTNALFAEQTKVVDDIAIKEKDAEVKAVEAMIIALNDQATLSDKDNVNAARVAYQNLTDEQKQLQVSPDILTKLTTAEQQVQAAEAAAAKQAADAAAAKAAENAIRALSSNPGINNKAAVEAARKAYDALTPEQKALVPADVASKLTTAEQSVQGAEQKAAEETAKKAADETTAKAAADAISALSSSAGLNDKDAVVAARAAYDALTPEQKALVPADVVAKLTTAEQQVQAAEQKAAEEAAKKAADETAAKSAVDAISALSSSAGLNDKDAVAAARAAYDALTPEQKALVPADVVAKLTTAEQQVQAAEQKAAEEAAKKAADETAAKSAVDAISALSGSAGISDKAAVEAARAAYDALTPEQKALVPADVVAKLTTAEQQVQEAEEAAKTTKISACKITVKDLTYTGKKIKKPTVTIKDGKKKLKEGTDYTISYNTKAKAIGAYKLTVTGKGNYTGTKKLSFNVNPKGTTFSKLTGGKQQITLKWKNPKNITGYEIQYSLKKGFSGSKTVKIKKAKTLTTTVKKLKAGQAYYVRIRTYTTVKKKNYYSAWSKAKAVKTKAGKVKNNSTVPNIEVTMNGGEKLELKPLVSLDASDTVLTWTTSDETIATVSLDGIATALTPGEVVITATNDEGEQVRVIVRVNEAEGVILLDLGNNDFLLDVDDEFGEEIITVDGDTPVEIEEPAA